MTSTLGEDKNIQYGNLSHSWSESQQEFSKWEAALEELLKLKFVKNLGTKGAIFTVTKKGYEYLQDNDKT